GRDRATVTGQDGADALVDHFAPAVDGCRIAQPRPAVRRRLGAADRPEDKARGADLLEVHRAGKVVAARHQGFERRRQASLECNEAADRRGRALAYRDPHAIGLLGEPRPLDAVDAEHPPSGTLPLLADL